MLILQTLEWLSRYGLIDIFFGVGILAYIQRLFRKSKVTEIRNVEILRKAASPHMLEIEIRNLSTEALYIGRASFSATIRKAEAPAESKWSFLYSFFFFFYFEGHGLSVAPSAGTTPRGEYLLDALDQAAAPMSAPIALPRQSIYYRIPLDPSTTEEQILMAIAGRACGTLELTLIHGRDARTLIASI